MSFHLYIACDYPGCANRARVEDEEAGPSIVQTTASGEPMFIMDSGWIVVDGWGIVDGAERCPEHRGQTALLPPEHLDAEIAAECERRGIPLPPDHTTDAEHR